MLIDDAGRRRRIGALATALAVFACALAGPAAASANIFTVDSTADDADADLGMNGCLTAGVDGKCTLRAAIEESNSSVGESDEIVFDNENVFNGQIGGTIDLSSELPAIDDPVRIEGRQCPTAAGVSGPCVGIDGPDATKPALAVANADFVEIEGFAVTGAQAGIDVISSEGFKVLGSWFGVKLDGSAGGNTTGVSLDPESRSGRIGGEGPGAGNVFANSAGVGLDILGAGNVRVLGNYFGVEPDGATHAANGKDIEITASAGGEFNAIGNSIGTRVKAGAVATQECDGGCNLISGAASNGIDLEGDGGSEAPAGATTIAGNYIGLDLTGVASVPNVAAGIRVGKAAQTVIGGPKAGEANRINGGGVGVSAGPAAADLVVHGNLIGVDAAGTGTLAPPGEGIFVNSAGLSSVAVEAAIVDNEIRMEGGLAIAQRSFGARISGNEISGAETGIRTSESSGKHGNLIEGNSIEGAEVNGILVENDFNEILGNEISDAGAAGIRIDGSLPFFGVMENLVGGNAATDENVIAGSGGAAIEIVDLEKTVNEVARNRGSANNGLFLDLAAVSPGAESGPNRAIEPPLFVAATQVGASGSGAKAGAHLRVFRKQSAEAGELGSFLAEAIADEEGNWQVTYAGAIPAGAIVAAAQTSEGGTSELATATTSGESGGGGGGGGANGGPSGLADESPPKTKIVKGPRNSQSSTVQFKFDSDEPGSTFLCKLDRKPFKACRSPKKYRGLKPGKHVFKVRAIDPAGNADSTAAKRKFTVQR